ncbi:hypothetical protein PUR71_37135 [Streptomyces sp. SP17BM10]|uniref:hypothetical protein n=1 Tax=Streptomyces sp. SP17BM10 TaxID=3002530 RepID=UPI002E77531A|nr:hypothetical protein [Streptomyces sp. SP17BM10]MEE1788485.1 hypothetical protein [Streptomyces sp. SP17BM10]
MIAPPGAEAAGLAAALAPVRAEAHSLLVLAAAEDAAPVLRASLTELTRSARGLGVDTLVLAASGLAAPGPEGRRPAELIAGRTGLTVVAPDAVVSVEPDGTLRVAGGSWWRCRPGDLRAEAVGERWPAATTLTPLAGGGFWATPGTPGAPGAPAVRPAILDRASGRDGAVLLVVGEPSGSLPSGAHVVRSASELMTAASPDSVLLLSAPWAEPIELVELAAVVAASLRHEVRAAIGLPVRDGAGHRHVHVAPDGTAGWEPYLTELAACPVERKVTAVAWRGRPDAPAPPGPARYPAFPGWELEAVAAGLWLRPSGTTDRGPRMRRPDPARPVLVVGTPGRPVTEDTWAHLGNSLGALPSAPRLGLVVAGTMDTESQTVGRFCARLHGLDWLGPELLWPAPELPGGAIAEPAPPEVGGSDFPLPVLPPASLDGAAVPALPDAPDVGGSDFSVPVLPGMSASLDGAAVPVSLEAPEVGGSDFSVPASPSAPERDDTEPPHAEATPEPVPAPRPVSAVGGPRDGVSPAAGGAFAGSEPSAATAPDAHPASGSDGASPQGPSSDAVPSMPHPAGEARPLPPSPASPPTPPADRAAVVALLGGAYPRLARRAEDAATRLPGLRPQGAGGDPGAELVAVLLHHTESDLPVAREDLVAAARTGAPGPLGPYLRCLAAGLRRLPSHYGGVLLAAPAGGGDLARFTPGAVFTEWAPVSGLAAVGADLGEDVGVEFAVWSVGGRRCSAFGEPGEPAAVVFAPGTGFEVVAVDEPDPAAGVPARVLLHEVGSIRPAAERLRTWLARRDAIAPPDRVRPPHPAHYRLDLGAAG